MLLLLQREGVPQAARDLLRRGEVKVCRLRLAPGAAAADAAAHGRRTVHAEFAPRAAARGRVTAAVACGRGGGGAAIEAQPAHWRVRGAAQAQCPAEPYAKFLELRLARAAARDNRRGLPVRNHLDLRHVDTLASHRGLHDEDGPHARRKLHGVDRLPLRQGARVGDAASHEPLAHVVGVRFFRRHCDRRPRLVQRNPRGASIVHCVEHQREVRAERHRRRRIMRRALRPPRHRANERAALKRCRKHSVQHRVLRVALQLVKDVGQSAG